MHGWCVLRDGDDRLPDLRGEMDRSRPKPCPGSASALQRACPVPRVGGGAALRRARASSPVAVRVSLSMYVTLHMCVEQK